MKQKPKKHHLRWLCSSSYRSILPPLHLKASFHAGQKNTTVLFQNLPSKVEKTTHFVLKNRSTESD